MKETRFLGRSERRLSCQQGKVGGERGETGFLGTDHGTL